MPVATPRRVSREDLDQATQLTDAMSRLIAALPGSNSAEVQAATNSLLVDMAAFAKELIKTEVPSLPAPPVAQ
ncbi:hypothetical protein SAMN05216178_2036 [Pseudomonas saponiphila]|uniref:Uncharacterized protein n=1 Tax=Pseudomonas saponiphila TaxID=556534 RepID=A0A1H4LR12_9PSED|nr:hypothetical protein [Pseudomonas saponiphila]SEB73044.1 hypothetical protein SAMN05216178_2036 [Pseudomonas saponiphila]